MISNYVLIFGSTTLNTFAGGGDSCELISNYVLIFGSTTFVKSFDNVQLLWIDFKLCSYFWFDNQFIYDTGISTLWIDFKLCSYFWFDNSIKLNKELEIVVNWFQIMFLFLVRQPINHPDTNPFSCELISNYVLIFGSTTNCYIIAKPEQLWIDFKLCSYFWFDNKRIWGHRRFTVVNWFQIMFLFLVRQPLATAYAQVIVVNWFQIMFLFLVRQPSGSTAA